LKELDDLVEEMERAEQDLEYERAFHYDLKSEWKADDICDILKNIRDIEENIKEKDSSFLSLIETPDFV
jgi:hypothetical protein